MRVFSEWKWTEGIYMGQPIYEIRDPDGTDWYELMVELDDRPEKWAIGVGPTGNVMWVTTGPVSGKYAPLDGGTIVLTDDFEFESGWRGVMWDGEVFSMAPTEEPKQRTKAEIEADLNRLLAELKAME